jgi:hypothetical protein
MAKISESQKWVVYWMVNGFSLRRTFDYVCVIKHPFEYRVSLNTFRAMFDKGLIELSHEISNDQWAFCLTKRAADLLKAGELSPRMSHQNKKVLPAVSR